MAEKVPFGDVPAELRKMIEATAAKYGLDVPSPDAPIATAAVFRPESDEPDEPTGT